MITVKTSEKVRRAEAGWTDYKEIFEILDDDSIMDQVEESQMEFWDHIFFMDEEDWAGITGGEFVNADDIKARDRLLRYLEIITIDRRAEIIYAPTFYIFCKFIEVWSTLGGAERGEGPRLVHHWLNKCYIEVDNGTTNNHLGC
jgi:hypothetical protein